MRAKQYAFIIACAAAGSASLGGCTTMKRLAPPGFVKYEDRAKGVPVNPLIVTRVKEAQGRAPASYPNLSAQPQKQPDPPNDTAQASMRAELVAAAAALNAGAASDRAAVEGDRASAFAFPPGTPQPDAAAAAAALKAAVDADRAAAAADKSKSE